MNNHTNGHSTNRPALIIFGKPSAKRPHGAWFRARDAAIAKWVARRLGLAILKVKSNATRSIVQSLAEWEIDTAGQPVVPIIKTELFDTLFDLKAVEAAAWTEDAEQDATTCGNNGHEAGTHPQDPKLRETARKLWDAFTINSLVLAREHGPTDGWWEAVILGETDGIYTLCFRDYPEQGLVKRGRQHIALLPPPE